MEKKVSKKVASSRNSDNMEKEMFIAKKNWRIICGDFNRATGKNEHDITIKKGDKVNVPKQFIDILKRENVI